MNKVLTAALMGLSAMALVGCSQDETSSLKGSKYKGVMESAVDSRSYNTNKEMGGPGDFKWSEGDDIKVWTKYDKFQTLKLESTDGDIAYYKDDVSITPYETAVFPVSAAKDYDVNNAVVTVNYPAAYDYTQRNATEDDQVANDPMVAFFGKGATTFNFRHTGAVIEWQVMVPAQANQFVATMSKDVTGDFNIAKSSPVAVTSGENGNNVVTFTFAPADTAQLLYFYMPVPTGEYHISKVAVKKDGANLKEYENPKGAEERTIGRAKWIHVLLNMSSYKGVIEDVSNAEDLKQVAAAGGIATLNADIDLDTHIVVKSGVSLAVNLNNKTVSNSNNIADYETNKIWSLFSAQGGTLEINGEGTVKAKENDVFAVDVRDGGKVVINGGHFYGNECAVYAFNGTVEINGGIFEIQKEAEGVGDKYYEYVLNCYDSSYKAGTASIVVKGGTFVGFNPANCKAEGANTNFVADGYISVETTYNGKKAWTVKKLEVSDGKVYADGTTYSDIKSACTAGATTIYVGKGTYAIPSDISNVTIIGTTESVLNETGTPKGNNNVTYKNITFQGGTADYQGIQHSSSIKFVGCTFTGRRCAYAAEVVYENCTFNQSDEDYNIWTYGAEKAIFNNCTFNGVGKAVLVYREASSGTDLVKNYFNNCKFIATSKVSGKAAIEIDSSLAPAEVYITNCTSTGFDNGSKSGNSLWNNKKGDSSNLKVTVDGVEQTLN